MVRRIGLQTVTVVQGRHHLHPGTRVFVGARVAVKEEHQGCSTVTT